MSTTTNELPNRNGYVSEGKQARKMQDAVEIALRAWLVEWRNGKMIIFMHGLKHVIVEIEGAICVSIGNACSKFVTHKLNVFL